MLRKSLLALSFIFLCPIFGCAKTQYYNVTVECNEHCYSEKPRKAQWGREYNIKITPNEGYLLELSLWSMVHDGLFVFEEDGMEDMQLSTECYDNQTCMLTIPSNRVHCNIKIIANAYTEEII